MFALEENKEINKVERLNVDKYLDYSFQQTSTNPLLSQKSKKSKFTAKFQQYNGNTSKMTDQAK